MSHGHRLKRRSRSKLMRISLIVAVADNGVIGKKGSMLPWHLSGDLRHFKQLTMGYPIIMGRATYETFRRPLPGRQNIIVTRDQAYHAEGCAIAHSIEDALQSVKEASETFIIGGNDIFQQTLSLASKIYLTRVHASPEGDVFFHFNPDDWLESDQESHPADEKNQYPYSFSVLTRR